MSIFKEHKTIADRSASDRSRHKKKIEKAIREGIHDIVADESIIGQDGKKKIKIPVKGIKEYRFVYGDNDTNKQVGSAPGKNIRKGQQIGKADKKAPAQGDKPGKDAGEEYYDVEISLEELAAYLFDSLNLPDLEKKRFTNIIGEKMKRHGYRNQGIRPRLDKKETLKRKLRRKNAAKRAGTYDESDEERFPFHENDLRYKLTKQAHPSCPRDPVLIHIAVVELPNIHPLLNWRPFVASIPSYCRIHSFKDELSPTVVDAELVVLHYTCSHRDKAVIQFITV